MKVSIFMFCKNSAATIRRAIESVLTQGYKDLEFVVQDGQSTDGTLAILEEYGHRIELRSERDSCPGEAFFRALSRCTGDIVGSCLADEELLPGSIEDAVAAFDENSGIAALTRDALLTDREGRLIGEFKGRPFTLREYVEANYVPHFSASFFKRSSILASGILRRPWRLDCGEYEFWIRLMLQGDVLYSNGFASKYCIHDDQLSNQIENVKTISLGRLALLKDIFEEFGSKRLDGARFGTAAISNARVFSNELKRLGSHDPFEPMVKIIHSVLPVCETDNVDFSEDAFSRLAEGAFRKGDFRSSLNFAMLGETACGNLGEESFKAMARAYIALGEGEKAQALFKSKASLLGDDLEWLGRSYHEIACLYEKRGEIERALTFWEKADVYPNKDFQSLALVARLKSPSYTLEGLLQAHDAWAEKYARPNLSLPPLPHRLISSERKIRIGVSCSFWSAPTISYQFLCFVDQLDSSRFEIIAYANSCDGFTAASGLSIVRKTAHLSDDEFVTLARSDELDILVELNGHSPGHRFAAMANRCAPIQVSYLNYTATSGVREVDYLLADEVACPAEEHPFYREQVFLVDGSFFCFNYEKDVRVSPAARPSDTKDGVVFGCFSSGGKINPQQIAIFARVLQAVPGSKILIRNGELKDEANREWMRKQFRDLDIPPERVVVAEGLPRNELLEEYNKIDVALDTYPYNGGNTIAEALWQGVPIIVLRGERFSSRYGSSLLKSSGCEEFVAQSVDEFVEKAKRFGEDRVRLAAYRDLLPRMMKEHGFSDTEKFARKLEGAFLEMVRRYNVSRCFYQSCRESCIPQEVENASVFRPWIYVTSMPRSGTWYLRYLFHVFDYLLSGAERFVTPPANIRYYQGLGLNALHSHATYFKYNPTEDRQNGSRFESIEYAVNGYGFGDGLQHHIAQISESCPISIYVFRNPLDQCVSMYRHLLNHASHSSFKDEYGSPSEYFRKGGLASYMKQFYSHYRQSREDGDSILMIRYEDLKANPAVVFEKIILYALKRPLLEREKVAFRSAVESVVPENLKALESLTGGALGKDQSDPKESHMRGGVVGSWRESFGSRDIELLKETLRAWNVPLSVFEFGYTL